MSSAITHRNSKGEARGASGDRKKLSSLDLVSYIERGHDLCCGQMEHLFS